MRISIFIATTWAGLILPPPCVLASSDIVIASSSSSFVPTLPVVVPSSPPRSSSGGGRQCCRPVPSPPRVLATAGGDDRRYHYNEDDDIEIPIIFENDRLLAVNKPCGVPHHDDPSTGELGIMSLLRNRQQLPFSSSSSPSTSSFAYRDRLYGVHRLDRVTSGILLLAKDPETAGLLASKFRDGEIAKFYAGVSGRKPTKKKQGWVRGVMTKGRRGCYKLLNGGGDDAHQPRTDEQDEERADGGMREVDDDGDEVDGRQGGGAGAKKGGGNVGYAATRFYTAGLGNLPLHPSLSVVDEDPTTVDDHRDPDGRGGGGGERRRTVASIPRTAMLFRPHTGKTHQLRVAAKSLSMPILGDVRYGGGRLPAAGGGGGAPPSPRPDGVDDSNGRDWDRTYLHASAVHFELDERESVTVWSPPPFGGLATGLDEVFVRLMEKHCDCPQILDAIYARSLK